MVFSKLVHLGSFHGCKLDEGTDFKDRKIINLLLSWLLVFEAGIPLGQSVNCHNNNTKRTTVKSVIDVYHIKKESSIGGFSKPY